MSQKWRESQAWDDRHIPRWAWPARFVLRTLSSIWLAVILLVLVIVYGILASVPIGLLAKAPTYLLYGLTALLAMIVAGGAPALAAWRLTRRASRGVRFAVVFPIALAGIFGGAILWANQAWPAMRWDPSGRSGLMLFSGFVEANKSITLRRLPSMEMTELQFYAWWPLRTILLLFVINLVVATVRRIEFTFKNLGVLGVHTGIVLIALGSIYYGSRKLEGDTLLLSGMADPVSGQASPGPPSRTFFDANDTVLYVQQARGWEQRPLVGVPRYNDYNLGATAGVTAAGVSGWALPWLQGAPQRFIDVPIPSTFDARVDPDLAFRIVGYANYVADQTQPDWEKVDVAPGIKLLGGQPLRPFRLVFLHAGDQSGQISELPAFSMPLTPTVATGRTQVLAEGQAAIQAEYTLGMDPVRWRDLSEKIPPGATHALAIDIPGTDGAADYHKVLGVNPGDKIHAGETGYEIEVQQLLAQPPFQIITPGYENAQSSVAVLKITGPAGKQFTRYVYHRFPEISQDLSLTEKNERGMPRRTPADAAIRVGLIDATAINVYFDEPAGAPAGGGLPPTRAIVRVPGGEVTVVEDLGPRSAVRVAPMLELRVGERWAHCDVVERPIPLAPENQDRSLVGTHARAMLAVEVTSSRFPALRRVVWLPFAQYFLENGPMAQSERGVDLPDGRRVRLAFGRRQYALPGFALSLVDFQMLSYDHRGAPRDYQSVIDVQPTTPDFSAFRHVAKLNAPLTAPFHWDDGRPWLANFFGRLTAGLDPNQFKFSQSGWDQQGWQQSQRQVDMGQLKRPHANFTILHVGNNPGIHVIALGAILMGAGIPWAFYLKPWLVKREKKRIQRQVAEGTYVRPDAARSDVAATAGVLGSRAHSTPANEEIGATP